MKLIQQMYFVDFFVSSFYSKPVKCNQSNSIKIRVQSQNIQHSLAPEKMNGINFENVFKQMNIVFLGETRKRIKVNIRVKVRVRVRIRVRVWIRAGIRVKSPPATVNKRFTPFILDILIDGQSKSTYYTFCCSFPENILSLTPTSNSSIQNTFILFNRHSSAQICNHLHRRAFYSTNRRPLTLFYYT